MADLHIQFLDARPPTRFNFHFHTFSAKFGQVIDLHSPPPGNPGSAAGIIGTKQIIQTSSADESSDVTFDQCKYSLMCSKLVARRGLPYWFKVSFDV